MTQTPASAPLLLVTVPRISLSLTGGCCASAGGGTAPVSARTMAKIEYTRNRSGASAGLIGRPSQAAIEAYSLVILRKPVAAAVNSRHNLLTFTHRIKCGTAP